jgi:hypothetical protein
MDVPATFDFGRWRLVGVAAMLLFLVWTHIFIGLRVEHFVITGVFMALFGLSRKTAWFAYLVLPFLMVGIGYENLRLVLPYRPEIHVADLYNTELALFGISTEAGRVIPPLYFKTRNTPILDLITGVTYILYLIQTFAFGAFLVFKAPRKVAFITWGFFLLNLLGWVTWIVWPAAPPWYADKYGLGPAILDAPGDPAGAARFDALLGIQLFHGFYARNGNVFGAMPSLHCAYPTLVALVAWSMRSRLRLPALAFAGTMYFSAVYLQHHYVLDVIAGITYAITVFAGMLAYERWRAASHATLPEGSTVGTVEG